MNFSVNIPLGNYEGSKAAIEGSIAVLETMLEIVEYTEEINLLFATPKTLTSVYGRF